MGLWSSVKKGLKKVFSGVKKVFKKVGRAAKKFFSSKLGKVILIAAAVVTAGAALYAAYGAYTTTAGTFLTKFVAGAKAFVGALASPVKSAKNMFGVGAEAAEAGGQVAAGIENATAVSDLAGTGVTTAPMEAIAGEQGINQGLMAGADSIRGMGPDLTGLAGNTAGKGLTKGAASLLQAEGGGGWMMPALEKSAAETVSAGAGEGWLSKAASGALKFAKSTGGGLIAGQMISGYAGGKQQEELLKEQERVRRYYDNDWKSSTALENVNYDINAPQGYLSRAGNLARGVRDNQPDRGLSVQYGGGGSNYIPVGA